MQGGTEEEEVAMVAAWKDKAAAARTSLEMVWAGNSRRPRLLAALLQVHAPLSPNDLNMWRTDPEDFYHTDVNDVLDSERRGGLDVLLRVRFGLCAVPEH